MSLLTKYKPQNLNDLVIPNTAIKDLLDDIHEFSQSPYKNNQAGDNDRFYCLQPIIVTQEKEKGAWKVIDGQQRLTTLYLIYLYYNHSNVNIH